MSELQISQGCFRLSDTQTLILPALHIQAGDCWAFVGANGSGKSALAKALSGELALLEGSRQSHFRHGVRLSFEQLQQLVNEEWQRNNTDLLSADEDDTGRTTAEIIQEAARDPQRCHNWQRYLESATCFLAASNTFLRGKPVKHCCVRR